LFGIAGRAGVSDVAVGRVEFEQVAAQVALVGAYPAGSNGAAMNGSHSDQNGSSSGASAATWDAALGMGTLDVLAGGSIPSNPSDFVGSPDLRLLLEQVQEQYDIVLLDAPGLLQASDAARISQFADAMIATSSIGAARRDVIRECARLLDQTPAPMIGVVSTDDATASDMAARGNAARRQEVRRPARPAAEKV
ncbi:MAG: hypothetical protein ACRDKI_05760, partial [Solirubrobacterales bacterium]